LALGPEPVTKLKEKTNMKKLLAVLIPLTLCAAVAFAQDNDDSLVRWKSIVGVITSPGVDAPVGNIHAGATAWTVRSGRASVNLSNGDTYFEVEGLNINSTTSTGTPGPITAVTGTLVCFAADRTQTNLDTTAVSLDAQGNAHFAGRIAGVPASCGNPLFLIRIAAPAGAAGRWIANGTDRFIGDNDRK
jgi:hypothetical protein